MCHEALAFESDPVASVFGVMLAQPSLFESSSGNRVELQLDSILLHGSLRGIAPSGTGTCTPF
jgi:hypothetical protein